MMVKLIVDVDVDVEALGVDSISDMEAHLGRLILRMFDGAATDNLCDWTYEIKDYS